MGEVAATNRNVFSNPQTTFMLLYHTEAVAHKRGQEGMFKDGHFLAGLTGQALTQHFAFI